MCIRGPGVEVLGLGYSLHANYRGSYSERRTHNVAEFKSKSCKILLCCYEGRPLLRLRTPQRDYVEHGQSFYTFNL